MVPEDPMMLSSMYMLMTSKPAIWLLAGDASDFPFAKRTLDYTPQKHAPILVGIPAYAKEKNAFF